MNARINHILDEALALDHDERSALMVTLLDSLDTDSPASVVDAWAEEIRKRKSELESGVTKPIPWATVKARIQAL